MKFLYILFYLAQQVKLNDEIKCPQCGRNHDLMGRCPGCKMSYDELLKMLYEDMENQKEDNENEVE